MKKLFTIIAVAIMMFIGSVNNAMAQKPVASAPGVVGQKLVASAPGVVSQKPIASAPGVVGHHHHDDHAINPATGLYHEHCNGLTYDTNHYCYKITKVEKCTNHTSVYITIVSGNSGYTYLDSNITLTDNTNGQKWYLQSTNNFVAGQNFYVTAGVPYDIVLNFQPLLRSCQSISLDEHRTDDGSLVFHNITGFSADYMN